MPKLLWRCGGCDYEERSDPLGSDDWGGKERIIGPDCPSCDDEMELVEESDAK